MPMCMDSPKQRTFICMRTLLAILFVSIILFIFIIPPPLLKEETPVTFVTTIEEYLDIDYLIETQDNGFAFVVAERPPYSIDDEDYSKIGGIANFIKTDKNGRILWNTTLPITQTNSYLPFFGADMGFGFEWCLPINYILETANGNFLVSSYSASDPILILVSNTGEILHDALSG